MSIGINFTLLIESISGGEKLIGKVIRGEKEAEYWYVGAMKTKEAANYLGISQYMLRKLVKENKIPYTRLDDKRLLFHKKIIDAWKKGDFQSGQVKLLLDKETIDFDYEEALQEHYERYPELKVKEKHINRINKSIANSNIKYKIINESVYLTLSDQPGIEVSVCLSFAAIKELYNEINTYSSR